MCLWFMYGGEQNRERDDVSFAKYFGILNTK